MLCNTPDFSTPPLVGSGARAIYTTHWTCEFHFAGKTVQPLEMEFVQPLNLLLAPSLVGDPPTKEENTAESMNLVRSSHIVVDAVQYGQFLSRHLQVGTALHG